MGLTWGSRRSAATAHRQDCPPPFPWGFGEIATCGVVFPTHLQPFFPSRRPASTQSRVHALLDPLLRTQHGVVTRQQCREVGLTNRQVDTLLGNGLLVPVFRAVFRDPASPITVEQRALASARAGGDGAVASHRLALALWGMRNYRCDLCEITAPRKVVHPGLIAHRSRIRIIPKIVRGVPVTTPARTLLDCASVISAPLVARFAETWLSTGVVTLKQLDRELSVSNGHHGAGVLGSALSNRTLGRDEADSPAEATLGKLLMRHLLPRPTSHHLVTVSSGSTFELDWSYPDRQLAFEMDGYGVHLRSLDAFEHDHFRRNELEIDGWTVLNFSRRHVERSPAKVIDQVRRLLGRRVR